MMDQIRTTTPQALAILKKYNAKSHLLMVGKKCQRELDIATSPQRSSNQNYTWIILSCQN